MNHPNDPCRLPGEFETCTETKLAFMAGRGQLRVTEMDDAMGHFRKVRDVLKSIRAMEEELGRCHNDLGKLQKSCLHPEWAREWHYRKVAEDDNWSQCLICGAIK